MISGRASGVRLDLESALRLIVITDVALAAPRSVREVVKTALEAGARCIQLRRKSASARELLSMGHELRDLTRGYGAMLVVNDRMDVALACHADGVHLGPGDLPVAAARRIAPSGFVIGYSTDDPEAARSAVDAGADYVGCGTVFPTTSKTDAGTAIGLEGLRRVVRAVDAPVVGIGGVGIDNAGRVLATGAVGVAVISAVMAADDPVAATRALLESRR